MKIKTTVISSSFDKHSYPRSIACVQCTIQDQDNELSFYFVRKADFNTVESFIENDNLCQNLAIQKALKMIKQLQNYPYESLDSDSYNLNSVSNNSHNKQSYKQKVIEIINLLNWNVDKLSKFVQKYKQKKINELSEEEWGEVYQFLSNKLPYISHHRENKESSNEIPRNSKDELDSLINYTEELIKPEEWEELI